MTGFRSAVPAIAAGLLLLAATGPRAQGGLVQQAAPPALGANEGWRLSVGAGALLTPHYVGSDGYRVVPVIAPELNWRNDGFFLSVRDGLGGTLFRTGAFSAGVVLRPRFGRDQDDNAALSGLGDVDIAGEAGGFLAYAAGPWRAKLELRQGFGGHTGLVADARADHSWRPRGDLILSAGPRLSWGDGDFARTYFGVDAGQSARSGYAEFRPSSYWFAAAAGSATWLATPRIGVTLFGEVGQILGDAADSPIVDGRGSATQAVMGLVVSFRFLP